MPSWRQAHGENGVDGKQAGHGRGGARSSIRYHHLHGWILITLPNEGVKIDGYASANLGIIEWESPFPKPEMNDKWNQNGLLD